MIRVTGRYHQQSVELDAPLSLSDGTVVEVVVRVKPGSSATEASDFADLGMARLEEEWDNPDDATYDHWKWTEGIAREWHDELADPREDIYTLADGEPVDESR